MKKLEYWLVNVVRGLLLCFLEADMLALCYRKACILLIEIAAIIKPDTNKSYYQFAGNMSEFTYLALYS